MRFKIVLSTVLIMTVLGSVGLYAATGNSPLNPTRKGRFLLDVEFDFNSLKGDVKDWFNTESKNTTSEFDLQLGYTVIANLEVGVAIGFEFTKHTSGNQTFEFTQKTTTNHLGLFARYYFGKGMFKPFVAALYTLAGTAKNVITNSPDQKLGITSYGVGAGFTYFVNDHFGLEVLGQYQKQKLDDKDNHDLTADTDYNAVHVLFGVIIAF